MIIYAIADLDILDGNNEEFYMKLKKIEEPDLLLFAGDMYRYSTPELYGEILRMIKWKCPIVAVFGNWEFPEDEKEIKKICGKRVTFLEDEAVQLKIKGETVGIVGGRGCLDAPTYWMEPTSNNVVDYYNEKLKKFKELLIKLKTKHKILLTHYASTYKTLEGEDKYLYPVLGSKKLEKVLTETKTTLAVHGHAHYGKSFAFVGKVPVCNVAYYITKNITVIDTNKLPKHGLRKFL